MGLLLAFYIQFALFEAAHAACIASGPKTRRWLTVDYYGGGVAARLWTSEGHHDQADKARRRSVFTQKALDKSGISRCYEITRRLGLHNAYDHELYRGQPNCRRAIVRRFHRIGSLLQCVHTALDSAPPGAPAALLEHRLKVNLSASAAQKGLNELQDIAIATEPGRHGGRVSRNHADGQPVRVMSVPAVKGDQDASHNTCDTKAPAPHSSSPQRHSPRGHSSRDLGPTVTLLEAHLTKLNPTPAKLFFRLTGTHLLYGADRKAVVSLDPIVRHGPRRRHSRRASRRSGIQRAMKFFRLDRTSDKETDRRSTHTRAYPNTNNSMSTTPMATPTLQHETKQGRWSQSGGDWTSQSIGTAYVVNGVVVTPLLSIRRVSLLQDVSSASLGTVKHVFLVAGLAEAFTVSAPTSEAQRHWVHNLSLAVEQRRLEHGAAAAHWGCAWDGLNVNVGIGGSTLSFCTLGDVRIQHIRSSRERAGLSLEERAHRPEIQFQISSVERNHGRSISTTCDGGGSNAHCLRGPPVFARLGSARRCVYCDRTFGLLTKRTSCCRCGRVFHRSRCTVEPDADAGIHGGSPASPSAAPRVCVPCYWTARKERLAELVAESEMQGESVSTFDRLQVCRRIRSLF